MRKHRRDSMRWRGFHYASPRSCYVTMCVRGRRPILSRIDRDRVILTQLGKIVEEHWYRIPSVFRHVELDAFVVMPNHVHAILRFGPPSPEAPISQRADLGKVIRWWKTHTALASGGAFWQRGYHDRVIRNEDELAHARGYIFRNPRTWHEDPENPARVEAP